MMHPESRSLQGSCLGLWSCARQHHHMRALHRGKKKSLLWDINSLARCGSAWGIFLGLCRLPTAAQAGTSPSTQAAKASHVVWGGGGKAGIYKVALLIINMTCRLSRPPMHSGHGHDVEKSAINMYTASLPPTENKGKGSLMLSLQGADSPQARQGWCLKRNTVSVGTLLSPPEGCLGAFLRNPETAALTSGPVPGDQNKVKARAATAHSRSALLRAHG